VNKVVKEKLPDLIGICRHNAIRQLELFGSCARDDFDPAASDLDFLAIFEEPERPGISQSYFNALRELRNLFGRKVDLLTLDSLTNPYLVDAVQRDRIVLCEKVDGIVIAKENQLSKTRPSIAARISDLGAIVSFSHILVHEYAGISNRIVWDLAHQRAPALLSEIEKLLREISATSDP